MTNIIPITPQKLILSGLIAAASFALTASGFAQTNAVSQFGIFVDGQFDGGSVNGGVFTIGSEWSDVTPAAFHSAPGVSATPVALNDPSANAALYAALGNNGDGGQFSLHLLYDFLPRTNPFVLPGELIASVAFPVTLPGDATGVKTLVNVLFQGRQNLGSGVSGVAGPNIQVIVDTDLDGIGDTPAFQLGLVGAVGFGPSALSTLDHLIVELGVSLRIPAGFFTGGGQLPGGGINPLTGLYDPDPVFWGAAGGADGTPAAGLAASGGPLQSASIASLGINHDGSTTVVAVPEPATAALLLAGFGVLGARRRKQTAA